MAKLKTTNVKGKLLVSDLGPNYDGGSPGITLAIGDDDTGFKAASDGNTEYWSNAVAQYNMKNVYHTGKKPSLTDLGAFGKQGEVVPSTNWNGIKTPGTYKVNVATWGSTSLGGPNSFMSDIYSHGMLNVYQSNISNEERTVQVYHPHRNDNSNPVVTRMLNGGTWSAWSKIGRGINKSDVGLGSVNNWGASSDKAHNSTSTYATTNMVAQVRAEKANTSHGNHVPTTQAANNAVYLRNDNTWQTITPAKIGAEAANSNIQAHISSAHAPSNAQKNSDITKAEIEAKLTGTVTTHAHNYASTAVATQTANGLMAAADKVKLNGIATGANNYTHPNDANTRHVTDAEKSAWNSKAEGDHLHIDDTSGVNLVQNSNFYNNGSARWQFHNGVSIYGDRNYRTKEGKLAIRPAYAKASNIVQFIPGTIVKPGQWLTASFYALKESAAGDCLFYTEYYKDGKVVSATYPITYTDNSRRNCITFQVPINMPSGSDYGVGFFFTGATSQSGGFLFIIDELMINYGKKPSPWTPVSVHGMYTGDDRLDGTAGWTELQNGNIMQWGQFVVPNGYGTGIKQVAIRYPMSFPNKCTSVHVTPFLNDLEIYSHYGFNALPNQADFILRFVRNDSGHGCGGRWIAIGY